MVQEHLREQAEVLAVYLRVSSAVPEVLAGATRLVLSPVDFEYRYIVFTVYFVAWRMSGFTFDLSSVTVLATSYRRSTHTMPTGDEPALHVLQAKLAQPQPPIWHALVFFRIRRRIPCLDIVHPKPNRFDLCRRRRRQSSRYRRTAPTAVSLKRSRRAVPANAVLEYSISQCSVGICVSGGLGWRMSADR